MKEKYLADRKILTDAAQILINEGKLVDFEAKTKEIEQLDTEFENASKAQANLNALAGKAPISAAANVMIQGGQIMSNEIETPVFEDMYDTAGYRVAFMKNVLAGSAIPSKFLNVDANTKTTDIAIMIPTTIMQKIVEKLDATGMILPLITRTSYKGGMSIPTSSVKPVAVWVAEGATSDKQKKTTGSITFNYYKLRCAISVSLEVDTTALPIFESTFINSVVDAMIKTLEQAIISGSGVGQPKGILTETVVVGQNVDIAKLAEPTYKTLTDAEGALPLAYESDAVWSMTKATFMKFIGMVDSQGQPVARTNYGVNGKPERTLLGRQVILQDYTTSLGATIAADTIVAFLFSFKDYVLNTNYQMTVKRYEDDDTENMVTKAIMLADGKVADKNSLVTITKKFA